MNAIKKVLLVAGILSTPLAASANDFICDLKEGSGRCVVPQQLIPVGSPRNVKITGFEEGKKYVCTFSQGEVNQPAKLNFKVIQQREVTVSPLVGEVVTNGKVSTYMNEVKLNASMKVQLWYPKNVSLVTTENSYYFSVDCNRKG